MSVPFLLFLAAALPLASFLVLIFLGRRMGPAAGWVGTGAMAASCALSVLALVIWAGRIEPGQVQAPEILPHDPLVWLPIDRPAAAQVSVGILADTLSVTMCTMVSAVGVLIHLFSLVFWKRGRDYGFFFAFLGLTCAAMLGVVLASGLAELFVFWSLLGLCTYVLTGFGFDRKPAIRAAAKTFIIHRIGDAAFLTGLAILVAQLGSATGEVLDTGIRRPGVELPSMARPGAPELGSTGANHGGSLNFYDNEGNALLGGTVRVATSYTAAEYLKFTGVHENVLGLHWLTWVGLCLLGGVIAKSAQFPLHVWLPDAAEGPAPAVALMFSATTIAAAVCTAARLFPILTFDARLFLAVIAATTLAVASLLALVATDLKKVLAYCAMSQAAFMLLFMGAGGYVAGLFHLLTQGFCLAGLCLAAGSVIDGCAGERELARMGGLWRRLPITALTFGAAALALCGAPFLCGWYTQRLGMGIVYDYATHLPGPYGTVLYWIAIGAAGVTAYTMCRVWWLTFGGRPRDQELSDGAREHSLMTLPLIVLALLAVFGGMMGIRELLEQGVSVLNMPHDSIAAEGSLRARDITGQILLWCFVLGVLAALAIYWRGLGLADRVRRLPLVNLVYFWLKHGMFFDLLYEAVVMGAVIVLGKLAELVDRYVVDGLLSLGVWLVRIASKLCGFLEARE